MMTMLANGGRRGGERVVQKSYEDLRVCMERARSRELEERRDEASANAEANASFSRMIRRTVVWKTIHPILMKGNHCE